MKIDTDDIDLICVSLTVLEARTIAGELNHVVKFEQRQAVIQRCREIRARFAEHLSKLRPAVVQ